MLKFLGSLFIVSSMTGIGIWKAEEVKHSYQALGKIYHLIGMMENELSYAGSEFGEMFECLSKKMDAPYRNWLLGMKIQMERRDGKTFSEIWEDNVNGFLKESGLGMEALNHLKMLGRNLGGADRQMQIWSMERYLKQIELQMDEMRKDIQMRMKVRICLGASAGILITIFLI